jgi:hypothetical protein
MAAAGEPPELEKDLPRSSAIFTYLAGEAHSGDDRHFWTLHPHCGFTGAFMPYLLFIICYALVVAFANQVK